MEALPLILAAVVFFTLRAWWRRWTMQPLRGSATTRGHSPSWGVIAWEWIRAHTRRDPGPDPDPDPMTLTAEYEWGAVDYTESTARRQHVTPTPHRPRPVVPPARPRPPADKAAKPLDVWVASSLENGARYADVLNEGRRLFGVSESTVKRSIRAARKAKP